MKTTSATIGIRYKNGLIKAINVEEEGYPGYTGIILYIKYFKIDKIEELLDLGDIKLLGEQVHPSTNIPHHIIIQGNEEEKLVQHGVVIANHRDIRYKDNGILTQQEKVGPTIYQQRPKKLKEEIKVGYLYIYDETDGDWSTYSESYKTGRTSKIDDNIDKYTLTENLLELGVISDLTREEIISAEQRGLDKIRRHI